MTPTPQLDAVRARQRSRGVSTTPRMDAVLRSLPPDVRDRILFRRSQQIEAEATGKRHLTLSEAMRVGNNGLQWR